MRRVLLLIFGIVAVGAGLVGAAFGSVWSPYVYEYLFSLKSVEFADSFMPYFPFVPFYPLLLIVLGAHLILRSRDRSG
jgi:hypothetical protein